MAPPRIAAHGLGKRYFIDSRQAHGLSVREDVVRALTAPWRWGRRALGGAEPRPELEAVWAVRDVSLEVAEGEVLGIVGRNGAGKSTLLRLLSRITAPTEGHALVRGRVGTLLEVGAGFVPLLSGRDNVYLSGAVLGMRRAEIRRRFDEIVAFAGVEQFIDVPVRRYSSGMYMRLGFAVAAHLDTEILIIDEALAVGDAEFQQKCLGRVGEVARGGRAVLFVSHDLSAVQRLCTKAVLLDKGRMKAAGPVVDVIDEYSRQLHQYVARPREWFGLDAHPHSGSGEAVFVAMRHGSPLPDGRAHTGEPFSVELEVECREALSVGSIEFFIRDGRGATLLSTDSALIGRSIALRPGRWLVRFDVEQFPLNPGSYQLGAWMSRRTFDGAFDAAPIDYVEVATMLEVLAADPERFISFRAEHGPVACRFSMDAGPAATTTGEGAWPG